MDLPVAYNIACCCCFASLNMQAINEPKRKKKKCLDSPCCFSDFKLVRLDRINGNFAANIFSSDEDCVERQIIQSFRPRGKMKRRRAINFQNQIQKAQLKVAIGPSVFLHFNNSL